MSWAIKGGDTSCRKRGAVLGRVIDAAVLCTWKLQAGLLVAWHQPSLDISQSIFFSASSVIKYTFPRWCWLQQDELDILLVKQMVPSARIPSVLCQQGMGQSSSVGEGLKGRSFLLQISLCAFSCRFITRGTAGCWGIVNGLGHFLVCREWGEDGEGFVPQITASLFFQARYSVIAWAKLA